MFFANRRGTRADRGRKSWPKTRGRVYLKDVFCRRTEKVAGSWRLVETFLRGLHGLRAMPVDMHAG